MPYLDLLKMKWRFPRGKSITWGIYREYSLFSGGFFNKSKHVTCRTCRLGNVFYGKPVDYLRLAICYILRGKELGKPYPKRKFVSGLAILAIDS